MTNALLFSLMLVAGFGIPIMAAMNANVGVQLSSAMAAVVVLCAVALGSAALLLAVGPRPEFRAITELPKFYLLGGVLFVLYIGSITFSAPLIGLSNAVLMVLIGQLLSAAFIDHFALFGALQSQISTKRVLGLVLMVAGAYLARKQVV